MAHELAVAGPPADVAAAASPVELARFGSRAGAVVLDTVIVYGVTLGLSEVLPFSDEDWYWISFAISYFFWVAFPVFFLLVLPVAFAASAWVGHGCTPGKIAMRLAIRDAETGGRPRFGQLLHREFSRGWRMVLLLVPAVIDHVAAARNPRRQTLHDRAAGTIVVRARTGFLRKMAASLAFSVAYVGVIAGTFALVYVVLLAGS